MSLLFVKHEKAERTVLNGEFRLLLKAYLRAPLDAEEPAPT